mmetsp:Transcript_16143/g.24131  ORF Transcript_16143/g.24131 Transcript_16143/m.24131 type:complete len:209 (-) Transcript_16143:25-651(-)
MGLFQLANGGRKLQLVVGYNLVTLEDSRTLPHGEGRLEMAASTSKDRRGAVNVKAGSKIWTNSRRRRSRKKRPVCYRRTPKSNAHQVSSEEIILTSGVNEKSIAEPESAPSIKADLGMGFLIAAGTTAAYMYWIMQAFKTSALLIMFVLLGKFLECKVKAVTSTLHLSLRLRGGNPFKTVTPASSKNSKKRKSKASHLLNVKIPAHVC